jgi:hypothetical protein
MIDLSSVSSIISYARSLSFPTPPDLGGHSMTVEHAVHLHRVPVRVMAAALATHDDLPWDVSLVERGRDSNRYYVAEIRREHRKGLGEHRDLFTLVLYSENRSESDHEIPTGKEL